jgi:hypothetical protein
MVAAIAMDSESHTKGQSVFFDYYGSWKCLFY